MFRLVMVAAAIAILFTNDGPMMVAGFAPRPAPLRASRFGLFDSRLLMQDLGMKNFQKICKGVAASLAICSSLSGAVDAKGFEASELFSKSEQALKHTQKNYQDVVKEWTQARKSLDASFNMIAKSSNIIVSISQDLEKLDSALDMLTATGDSDAATLASEIERLKLSAAAKYQAAEAAAQVSGAKPAAVSALFQKAQNEAQILEQTTLLTKSLLDMNSLSKAFDAKIEATLADLKQISALTQDVQAKQQESLIDLNSGIDTNLHFCRDNLDECAKQGNTGLATFKRGVSSVSKAQDKFNGGVRSLYGDLRAIQSIRNDFQRLESNLKSQEDARAEWEKAAKLTPKVAKPLLTSYSNDIRSILRTLEGRYTKFSKDYDAISSSTVVASTTTTNKNNKGTQRSVSAQLKGVQEKLENAQRSGIAADRLLYKARQQGEKEAARFIKVAPGLVTTPPSSSGSSTSGSNSGNGKSSSTVSSKQSVIGDAGKGAGVSPARPPSFMKRTRTIPITSATTGATATTATTATTSSPTGATVSTITVSDARATKEQLGQREVDIETVQLPAVFFALDVSNPATSSLSTSGKSDSSMLGSRGSTTATNAPKASTNKVPVAVHSSGVVEKQQQQLPLGRSSAQTASLRKGSSERFRADTEVFMSAP